MSRLNRNHRPNFFARSQDPFKRLIVVEGEIHGCWCVQFQADIVNEIEAGTLVIQPAKPGDPLDITFTAPDGRQYADHYSGPDDPRLQFFPGLSIEAFFDFDVAGAAPEVKVDSFVRVEQQPVSHIEPNSNPFHHDLFNMGTTLVRGWVVMHEGYDRNDSPLPLHYLILVNTRTGQRIHLNLRPL